MEELKVYCPYIISIVVGSLVPALLGLVFPRRLTIKYGMVIYRFIGTIFLQKRASLLKVNGGIWSQIGYMVRTTFADLSFGVYIASRENLSTEERNTKVNDYLNIEVGSDIKKEEKPAVGKETNPPVGENPPVSQEEPTPPTSG